MRIDYNERFPSEIDRQVEYRAGKVRVAEEVAAVARTISPYRAHKGKHYRDSLGVHLLGPAVYVRTTDWKGHWMEWGTVDTPTFAPIRLAALMTGLRIDEAERTRGGQRPSLTELFDF